jgi:hypothetical protein
MKHAPISNSGSHSLHKRLDRYVLAASAAGVGCLAMSQPASAEIVYTKVDQTIPFDTTFYLDLNHDGIVDFQLKNHETHGVALKADLFMLPASSNRAAGEEKYPLALPPGVSIGPDTSFPKDGDGKLAEWFFSFSTPLGPRYFGNWRHASNRYLGLKFIVNGEVHYGWARLTVDCQFLRPIQAKITGYAYETIADQSIDAGQTKESGGEVGEAAPVALPNLQETNTPPKSLGVLALGAAAFTPQRSNEAFVQ